MKKFIFFLILAGISLFLPLSTTFAQEQKNAVIVNPIRGNDFWQYHYSILTTPQKQYSLISSHHLPATWLVRYDALTDQDVQKFIKGLDSSQDVGLFLEITPTLTKDSGVKYNQSQSWHYAKSILLVGYSLADRIKLIDTAFEKYKQIFGFYPKSVGAWWIDAYSLSYMKQKYGITANLDVSDQYSTDQYQVWGQYWSSPFYPSKQNALMPADSADQKIGVVTMQWATRDPYNSYGTGVYESTHSVQANDYLLHDLSVDYFSKLLDAYPQTTVGLENDFDWNKYGTEYTKQLDLLAKRAKAGLQIRSMQSFANWYMQTYPEISPAVTIFTDDPLGSGGKVVWYQNAYYRVGWFFKDNLSVVRDLRNFTSGAEENCFQKACDQLLLGFTPSQSLDDANFGTHWVLDEGNISKISLVKDGQNTILSYINAAGATRTITFYPHDIGVDGRVRTVNQIIMDETSSQTSDTTKQVSLIQGHPITLKTNLITLFVNFMKFIILSFLIFFVPGWLLSRNKILALPIGWVVFTLTSFALGWLHVEVALFGFIAIGLLGTFYARKSLFQSKINVSMSSFGLMGLILVGSISWLLPVVRSGLLYSFGYGYWGPNGHDAIWHLGLISALQKNILPQNFVFSGEKLMNYHYFYNLMLAEFGKLFAFDNQDLLFRFFPVLLSIFSGLIVYQCMQKIGEYLRLSKAATYWSSMWAIFFVYFGGSFGWIVSYIRAKNLGGESLFWSMQSVSTQLNPPFAISLVLFFAGLVLFFHFLQQNQKVSLIEVLKIRFLKKNTQTLIPLILVWGSLIEFKAYAGVLVLASLGLYTIQRLALKRDYSLLPIVILSGLLSMMIFLPNNILGASLFIFLPFWFVTTLIQFQDKLFLPRLGLTMESGQLFKVIPAYGIGTILFLAGNMGTRIIGLLKLKYLGKIPFLLYVTLLGIMLPLLFVQKGTNWNSIQFLYYSLLGFAVLSGLVLGTIFAKRNPLVNLILGLMVLSLTIPTTWDTVSQYIPNRPPAMLSNNEMNALNFLKQQPDGIVFTLPLNSNFRTRIIEPRPLFIYESTAYVAAFSGKDVFVDDTVNLDILGIDYQDRYNTVREIRNNTPLSGDLLRKNHMKYLYIPKLYQFYPNEKNLGVKKIFDNDEVSIYQVL